jgi:hypothetical protein
MTDLTLTIKKVVVLTQEGLADRIYVHFVGLLPFPCWEKQEPSFQIDVAEGTGIEYVRSMFKCEPEVIQSNK